VEAAAVGDVVVVGEEPEEVVEEEDAVLWRRGDGFVGTNSTCSTDVTMRRCFSWLHVGHVGGMFYALYITFIVLNYVYYIYIYIYIYIYVYRRLYAYLYRRLMLSRIWARGRSSTGL
jgi:hypothetical protein